MGFRFYIYTSTCCTSTYGNQTSNCIASVGVRGWTSAAAAAASGDYIDLNIPSKSGPTVTPLAISQ